MATSRNRDYSAPPEGIKNMSANYAWSDTLIITGMENPQTGAWTALKTNLDGSLLVSLNSGINIDSLNISGINVNTDQLETINTSGVQYLASISGRLNNGLIGVTGSRVDSPSGYNSGSCLMFGGRAVNSATFLPGYVSGANVVANFDKDNGALNTNPGLFSRSTDSIMVWNSGASSVTEIVTGVLGGTGLSSGILLTGNASRQELFIQNMSTVAPTFIRFGNAASAQNFNVILNPSSTSGLGGGALSNERWRGAVFYSGGSCVAFEL